MRIRVDREKDAPYFRPDETRIAESEEIRPGVIPDFDENDQVMGVEVLSISSGASREEVAEEFFQIIRANIAVFRLLWLSAGGLIPRRMTR